MRELSLFSGAGGGLLATKHLLNWQTVGYVEWNEYCQKVIAARIRDGLLDNAPIFTDIRAFVDSGCAELYRGVVDVVSGGFPCQDISSAGKGAGIEGERSGLWGTMAKVIRIVRPQHVLVENSPTLTSRGLGRVLGDLAAMGFDARWGVLGARHIGACHRRDRIWICAHHSNIGGHRSRIAREWKPQFQDVVSREQHRKAVATARGNYDALAGRLGKCWHAIGNGQVPAVAATAWNVLSGGQ